MSVKSRAVRLFDRPGGRGLLAAATSWYARRLTQADVDVFYDGVWVHRSGPHCFPDGPRFRYYRDELLRWKAQGAECVAAAQEYWYHGGAPRAGEIVVDVGAGRGEDVLAFSQTVGPGGRVLAIEAHPHSFDLLQKFCAMNRLANVRAIHVATMDREGVVSMDDSQHWEENTVGRGHHQVPAKTLDDICRADARGPIGLVKMNIEGAETAALRGAIDVLQRTRLVAIACHDFRADRGHGEQYRTRVDVEQFLASQGFTVVSRTSDHRDWVRDHVFGVRPENAPVPGR